MLVKSRLLRLCKVKASNNTVIEAIKGTTTIIIIITTTEDEEETEVAEITIIEGTIITTKRILSTSNDLSKIRLSMGRSMTNNSLQNIKKTKETIEEGNVADEEGKINNEMEAKTHS